MIKTASRSDECTGVFMEYRFPAILVPSVLRLLMKKIINGWKHLKGVHCGSAALRDICFYYGRDLSEQMCFGLGAGLGFYYSCEEGMNPSRIIQPRGPLMEINFLRNFGVDVADWKYEDDNERASADLREFIDRDVPVLIQADIRYLEYFDSRTHFPGHIIAVCGYDDSESVFYVADNSFEDIQAVSFENMAKARSSKARPYPLSNNRVEVESLEDGSDAGEVILGAVRKNAEMMLEGRTTLRGTSSVEAIRKWAGDLPGWRDLADWKWTSRFAYQVICRRGVCGAAFRWFYRDFLEEVSPVLSPFCGADLPGEMNGIGKKWYDIGMLFKKISESASCGGGFERASELAFDIYDLEKRYFCSVLENFPAVSGAGEMNRSA